MVNNTIHFDYGDILQLSSVFGIIWLHFENIFGLCFGVIFHQLHKSCKIEDVERAAKVAETLENLSVVSPLVAVEGLSSVEHYKAVRRNTKKPLLIKCPAIDELIEILGMAQGLSGGHQEFAINPSFAVYIQSERPLELTDKDIKILKFCAENGIPVSYMPVVCPGETGPDSLAGCFVLGTATALAALTVQQLVKRGSPYIHGINISSRSSIAYWE